MNQSMKICLHFRLERGWLLDKKNVNCALLTCIPTEVEILDEANVRTPEGCQK